jgi:hypothetical protein
VVCRREEGEWRKERNKDKREVEGMRGRKEEGKNC